MNLTALINCLNKQLSAFLNTEWPFECPGSRIDHGHHDSLAVKTLYDTLAMEDAVKVAVEMTNEEDTMIIVTADHSHVFDIAGYAYRGTDIFGTN